MGGGGTSSVFGNFGESGAPGFVNDFAQLAVNQGQIAATDITKNRYEQLGMGGSTPEQMDLGHMPSVTGGIPEQFKGLMGELQNTSAGISTAGAGAQNFLSQTGSLLNAVSK
jgi:hypothetical protein